MKSRYFILVLTLFSLLPNLTYGKTVCPVKNDSLLYNIQGKIYEAFLSSFQENGTMRLEAIEDQIKQLPVQNQITTYWIAYAKYYEGVYCLKLRNKKECQKILSSAIELIEQSENRNSESYALLAFIQSFSIQLSGGMNAALVSANVKKNAEAALQSDSTNLRAWYVLASNDYYTPKAYGGGKKCEKYLLKAISLNDQSMANPFLPSWGKSDAYSLLIAYYIDKEDYDTAQIYLNAALSLYPNNYMINQYAEMLKNKK